MAKVGIVMGSDSDMPVMSKAADMLEKFGIEYEMKIISAHREPDVFFEYAKPQRRKASRLSLQAQVWQLICRVCAQLFSQCRSSEFRCIPHRLEVVIPCTPSYRCRAAFR